MAINASVTSTRPDGKDLIVYAEDAGTRALVVLRIQNATVQPLPGDFAHFGCAGVRQPDGSYFGGRGFISCDGHEFPYRRIGHETFIQDWEPENTQEAQG